MTKEPWNKNKSVGQKKAFTTTQIALIRKKLKDKCLTRDLALFEVALYSDLKNSDLLRLRVFEIRNSKDLLDLVTPLLIKEDKDDEQYVFTGRYHDKPLTRSNYALLVKKWVKMIGLDPKDYSTRSLINSRIKDN